MDFINRISKQRTDSKQQTELQASRIRSFGFANVGASHKDSTEYGFNEAIVDEYKGIKLVRRYIDTEKLERVLEGFTQYSVAKFFAKVFPPKFAPPDDDQYVVFGIVARRGEVRQSQKGSKYVSLLLCDLHYEIILTISGTAFDKYYKIRPGTLIAVCNPSIYVLRQGSETPALRVNSIGDPILEIGRAKDLGQCLSEVNGSTNRCKNWVNLQRTQVCEYHQELKTRRTLQGRPEFNLAPTKMYDPKHKKQSLAVYRGGSVKWKEGLQYDHQAPRTPIYQTGSFKGTPDFDHIVKPPHLQEKAKLRQLERIKKEAKLRKMLAKRDDGHMLREYEGGVLKNPEEYENRKEERVDGFTHEEIKRIGFDPSRMHQTQQRKRQKVSEESDSSDLEIID